MGKQLPAQGNAMDGPQDRSEEGARLPVENAVEDDGLQRHYEITLDALCPLFHLSQRGQRQYGLGSTGRSQYTKASHGFSKRSLPCSRPLKRRSRTRFCLAFSPHSPW